MTGLLARPLVALVAAVLVGCPQVAAAQRASPAPREATEDGPALAVRLVRSWFGPADPLRLEILVSTGTRPATNLRATVALYERVRSRSQLRQVVGVRLPRTPLEAFTHGFEDLPPGGAQRLTVEQGLDGLRAFQGAPDGLYPVSVTLRRSTGPAIRTVATAVALVSQPPETPLQVLPVVTVTDGPLLGPDGRPTSRTDDALAALRRGLPVAEPPPFGVAVAPLVVDELRALRDTPLRARAEAVEQMLQETASAGELLAAPYAHIDTGHVGELLDAGGLRDELGAGSAALRRGLGVDPRPILAPPGLALDDRALGQVAGLDMRASLVAGSSLPAAARGLTPADPAIARDTVLLPVDELLSRSAEDGDSDVEASRVVAEIAMVHFESPARLRLLTIAVDAASGRFPQLLAALRDLPLVRLVSPTEATLPAWRSLRTLDLPDPPRIPRAFERSLTDARIAVGRLAAFTMEGNLRVARLRAALRSSLSTGWWKDDWAKGTAWNRGIVRAVDRERRLVSTGATPQVTFTSRRGRLPIAVVNRAGYRVRVRVEIESAKLRFPDGSARVLDPLTPPGELVTFNALTDATGTFPVTVRITSPDGAVLVDEHELIVRSSAFNVVALALTVGAALFLVAWTSRLLVGRGRARPPTSSDA